LASKCSLCLLKIRKWDGRRSRPGFGSGLLISRILFVCPLFLNYWSNGGLHLIYLLFVLPYSPVSSGFYLLWAVVVSWTFLCFATRLFVIKDHLPLLSQLFLFIWCH
jgi:hypothetical protein